MRARRQADLYDGFRVDHLVGFYRTYVRPLDGRPPFFMPSEEPAQIELGETVHAHHDRHQRRRQRRGSRHRARRSCASRSRGSGCPGTRSCAGSRRIRCCIRRLSVAMTGTHDTEPLAVWWESLTPKNGGASASTPRSYDAAVRDRILELHLQRGLEPRAAADTGCVRMARSHQPACDDQRCELDVRAARGRPTPLTAQPEARRVRESAGRWSYQTGRWHPPLESTIDGHRSRCGIGKVAPLRTAARNRRRENDVDDVLPALERDRDGMHPSTGVMRRDFCRMRRRPRSTRALKTQPPDDFPLLWFGMYDDVSRANAR